eukprot:GFYU01004296.1.p1 GENE.GFYU01004296.1~~GFYU01004296.1.p1  ORF type:complete len:292 (-),score=84.46 GFYU01004296.1:287-1162(-)
MSGRSDMDKMRQRELALIEDQEKRKAQAAAAKRKIKEEEMPAPTSSVGAVPPPPKKAKKELTAQEWMAQKGESLESQATKRSKTDIDPAEYSYMRYLVINYLKDAHIAVNLDEIDQRTGIDLRDHPEMFRDLADNEKFEWDELDETFKYKPKYTLHNKDNLRSMIQNYRYGILAKEFEDSYPTVKEDHRALVKEREVCIIRNVEKGEWVAYPKRIGKQVSQVILEKWKSCKVPVGHMAKRDILEMMRKRNLQPAKFERTVVGTEKAKKKKRKQRAFKVQNSHVLDMLQDRS